MDVLKDLFTEAEIAAFKKENEIVAVSGDTYKFVVVDWEGRGKAHFHTFDGAPTRQEVIDWADKKWADGDTTFAQVEVSRMVENDKGDFFEVVEELENSKGHLVPRW